MNTVLEADAACEAGQAGAASQGAGAGAACQGGAAAVQARSQGEAEPEPAVEVAAVADCADAPCAACCCQHCCQVAMHVWKALGAALMDPDAVLGADGHLVLACAVVGGSVQCQDDD